jgi:hypothetical protein
VYLLGAVHLRDRVLPASVTRDLEAGADEFLRAHGDTQLLLVQLPEEPSELETTLASLWATGVGVERVRLSTQAIGFITQVQPLEAAVASTSRRQDALALEAHLRERRVFVVPLRKRRGAGSLSAERITVGRALNQDIVLREGSVSKFHGWIEMDEVRGVHVADAGSRNGTRVNDVRLPPRELREVQPGEVVRFGSVKTLIVTPETFLETLAPGT